MTLKTRKPTGQVPWPLILVEGPEKSGKSWACAELSASEQVGQTYWIDLGEGAADEYGAIPGSRYLVVEHDGSWGDIITQAQAVKEEAQKAAAAGEPPAVLVIDSMTAEWDLLKEWATDRAKKSAHNRKLLQQDPHAEVSVSMNLWNDATARHRRLMTLLLTFPGIVAMTARGKDVAELDDKGKPVQGGRDYKVEGHKTLAFDASVWVRMSREHAPLVIGARSVQAGLRPGVDRPKPIPDFTLEKVVFDVLGCEPKTAQVRDVRELNGKDQPDPLKAVKAEVWALAQARGWDAEALSEDYAQTYEGKLLGQATVDDLTEYRDILAHAKEAA
ncbi:AAA family ATPase [Crossiella sp. CA-258035]|uniref:AAA family ATPase n=1 Tax=Crossiella sp. CA-258035 TaxID=2981138 RepID=UPI0024BCCE9C|nr:AAA family ATPase [Crossiella sp. CA-258035]WHT20975.1 AAA family ATPase [Crossiella sp. CA-258035]